MTHTPSNPATEAPLQAGKANTDKTVWHGDGYRLFVTLGGGVGIEVNGLVIVKTAAAWQALASPPPQEPPAPVRAAAVDHVTDRMVQAAVVSYVNRNDQLRPTEWMRRVLVTALLVGTQDLDRENSRERKEEIWGM